MSEGECPRGIVWIALKTSSHPLKNQLWSKTSAKNIPNDELLMVSSNLNQAVKSVKKKQNTSSETMFFSLECQGILSKTVVESVKKAHIITWSNTLTNYAETGVQLSTESIATTAANCCKSGNMEENI